MSRLKLIINNKKTDVEKKDYFFNKRELKIILNLYAKMVSQGLWKDYSFNITKKNVSFSIYKRASERPLFNIYKNFKPYNYKLKYYIADAQGNILAMSEHLDMLFYKIKWYEYKIVN